MAEGGAGANLGKLAMLPKSQIGFDPINFFAKATSNATQSTYHEGEVIFAQGDAADSVFYIKHGRVKCTVVSSRGKEGIVAILGAGEFFGEGCVIGQAKRLMTAAALTACSVMRIEKSVMVRVLYEQPTLAEMFISFLIGRNNHYQEDLVDHLFNSSEKRLARTLVLLSNIGKDDGQDTIMPKISQETLAEIVGTTRSRINFFMNKFRQLGLIEYNHRIRVNRSLLDMVLQEKLE